MRAHNLFAYSVLSHRHEAEVLQSWRRWVGREDAAARLMVHSGPFVRGIYLTLHAYLPASQAVQPGDSAVAAWLMLKRGVQLDYVFCNLGGDPHRIGALRVMRVLADRWSYGYRPRLHELDFRPLVEAIQAETDPRLWQLLLKRQMLRAGEAIARRGGASGGRRDQTGPAGVSVVVEAQ